VYILWELADDLYIEIDIGDKEIAMAMERVMKQVTIKGETREVEFVNIGHYLLSVRPVGLFQKRPGQKLWPHSISLWPQPDGSFHLSQAESILNRSGYRLIGWADQATGNLSEHNSAAKPA
jgi:hypothetical protein